jgi:hypothetical protein
MPAACGTLRAVPEPMSTTAAGSKAKFIGVEHGARLLPYRCPDAEHDLVVLIQQADETASVFARRFVRKVVSARAEGVEIASAALMVAPDFHLSRLEARCAIARTLICSFPHGSEHELLLAAASDDAAESRPHLLALAEILREGAKPGCTIRVLCDRSRQEAVPAPALSVRRRSPARVAMRAMDLETRHPPLAV